MVDSALRARSSAVRAFGSHPKGHRFETCRAHHSSFLTALVPPYNPHLIMVGGLLHCVAFTVRGIDRTRVFVRVQEFAGTDSEGIGGTSMSSETVYLTVEGKQALEAELRDLLLTCIEHPAPAAIRYPRGNGFGVDISAPPQKIEIGKAEILRDGDGEVAIIAYGSMVYPAVQAADSLEKDGIEATVVNARFVKPLDTEMILNLARTNRVIITVEEAYLAGGFGSAVMELLEEKSLLEKVKIIRMGVPDRIITHGDAKLLLAKYDLDADGIYQKTKKAVENLEERRVTKNRLKIVK